MESPLSPERRRHTGILTAGAVVAMILAGLGIAGAQTSETPTTQAPAAQAQNVDPQKVVDALVTNITADLPERITAAVNQPGGPGGPGHGKRGGHHGPKPNLSAAATALGMSQADLRTALQSGQPLAQ